MTILEKNIKNSRLSYSFADAPGRLRYLRSVETGPGPGSVIPSWRQMVVVAKVAPARPAGTWHWHSLQGSFTPGLQDSKSILELPKNDIDISAVHLSLGRPDLQVINFHLLN